MIEIWPGKIDEMKCRERLSYLDLGGKYTDMSENGIGVDINQMYKDLDSVAAIGEGK